MSKVEERIKKLGYKLPECPVPVAAYVPAAEGGGMLHVSGQTAKINGQPVYLGAVGQGVSEEDAYEAAKLAALGLLAEVKYVIGDLDRVERIVKVNGYVNAVPGFTKQPKIINGASELFEEVFAEKGRHARVAVGVGSLPDNASVEVEMIISYK